MELQNDTTYKEKYEERCNETFKFNNNPQCQDQLQDSKFSYDAVWVAALALHKTNEELKTLQHVSLDNFTLDNTDMLSGKIASKIYNNALNASFYGATVSFTILCGQYY